jgi:hypothetical protein
MFVRFRTLSAGPAGVRLAGSIHEVSPAEGIALVAGGFASACDEQGKAVVEGPAETAVKKPNSKDEKRG